MPIFGRKRAKTPELPPRFAQMLTSYGDYLMNDRPNFDQKLVYDDRHRKYASQDPEGFVVAVSALVPAAAGATALGSCEVIYNIIGLRPIGDSWQHLLGQATLYLKYRQVPWSQLKDYQRDFLRNEGVEEEDW